MEGSWTSGPAGTLKLFLDHIEPGSDKSQVFIYKTDCNELLVLDIDRLNGLDNAI